MNTFFSKILHFAVGMVKSYFLIGIIIASLELILVVLYSFILPDDFNDLLNQQFAELVNQTDPEEHLMHWEVTAGDRVFLVVLILIVSCFIWPYILSILFERDSEE